MSSSSDHSYNNRFDGTDSIATSLDTSSLGRPFPRSYEQKHSSAYVPHNRLSRYATAFTSLIPVRFKRVPGSELPLDKIGLFSSISFSWLNEYLYAGYKNGMKDKPLPTVAPQDSCQVNGPRLDGLWHTHVVERGQAGASVPHIAWKFVRTRVLVASFIYLLGMLTSLLSPILILQQIILAIEERSNAYNNQTLSRVNVTTVKSNAFSTAMNIEVLVTSKEQKTTILAPLVNKLANATLNWPVKSTVGEKVTNKLPDSITHLIMIDEVITFSHVGILIIVEVISYFLIAWSATLNLRTASRLRSACLALVYKKLVRSSIRYTVSAHQTITYFVPDSETLYELITNGPLIFTGPLILLLTSLFIWHSMGHWALIGIGVLIMLYLCLIFTAYLTKMFATKTMEYSLKRMSLMEEFLNNMYLAKVTLWDRYFMNKIEDTRRNELIEMRFGGLSEGWSLCMVHLIPIITMCTTTMASLLTHKFIISSRYIPVLVLLLINLKHCIRCSWLAMSSISHGLASLNKLKVILTLKEAERYSDKPIDKNLAVTISHGNFTWEKNKLIIEKAVKRSSQFYVENNEGLPVRFTVPTSTKTLTDINFYAPKAKLIGICGQPNSGKTSLLLSIMGHLHHINGHVTLDGSCAYVPEVPWLLEGTLKENILFGEVFDSNRYYKAVHSCLLNNDMALLPESDDTELTYVNLSLAQKQRITLARVVYLHRDINLLDNPLADVDNNESKEIFDKCLMHALGTKTVIIVSDKIQFLNRCDIIYVMREGRIIEQGTHEELLQWNSEYTQLVNLYMKKYQRKYYRDGEQMSKSTSQLITGAVPRGVLTSASTSASLDSILDNTDESLPLKQEHNRDFLMKYRERERQSQIKYSIYVKYAGGWCLAIFICLISLCYSFFVAVAPLCFTYIAQKTIKDNVQIIVIFVTMIGSSILFGLILMAIYNKSVFSAAIHLHDKWLDSLYRAQIFLFTTTPTSVLLNIYCLNLHEADFVLPRSMVTTLMHIGISAFSVAILGLISPWLLIPITVFVLASIAYSIYVRGAILSLYEVKVNSVVPMYSHSVNTIEGRSVIQAFHKERDFSKKFYKYCDNNSTYSFMLYAIKLWLEYRIKMISALTLGVIILMCASLTIIRDHFELMGLAFICTLQLNISVVHLTAAITSAYTSFMALTGFDFYLENILKERPGTAGLSTNWPNDSSIKFDNVLLMTESNVNPNQEGLNFTIASGEKVAFTGTLPSMKMSLISTLYRFTDVVSGKIYVGNMNITEVMTNKLRQYISFVPGDPPLFDGSIRYNLDPSGKMTDKMLVTVLQRVFLWEKVSKLSDKLDHSACNIFTISEKKLLFFARAILKKTSKIIILEESMEDLDPNTELIEIVLCDVFRECTIIVFSNQRVRYCQRTFIFNEGKMNETSNRKSSLSQNNISATDILTMVPIRNAFETNF